MAIVLSMRNNYTCKIIFLPEYYKEGGFTLLKYNGSNVVEDTHFKVVEGWNQSTHNGKNQGLSVTISGKRNVIL